MSEPERPEDADRPAREQPENAPVLPEASQLLQKTEFFLQAETGPLPAPHIFNEYDPDTRRTIVTMAEKEQNHRHAFLDKAQREESKVRNFAFVITLLGLVSGGFTWHTPANRFSFPFYFSFPL